MIPKLNCILLIDDDGPTNFLNKKVIEKLDCTEQCIAVQSGQEALDMLALVAAGSQVKPDLILLDINMPAMNGWEFLEEYRKLEEKLKGHIIIVMLTTSLNPDDREMARSYAEISDFINKPLTIHALQNILTSYF